jgi:hypothetical protein
MKLTLRQSHNWAETVAVLQSPHCMMLGINKSHVMRGVSGRMERTFAESRA